MSLSALKPATPNHEDKPLISEVYLDIPSQRLYYLSFGALSQVGIAFPLVCHLSPTRNLEYQVV